MIVLISRSTLIFKNKYIFFWDNKLLPLPENDALKGTNQQKITSQASLFSLYLYYYNHFLNFPAVTEMS